MSLRLKSARGSLILILGEGVVFASSFVRNVILARLLTKADFGIAATFSMTISLMELSAKMGVARFLVRDAHGNDPDCVATAHLVQFGVALVSAVLMAAAAWPLAHLFHIPDHLLSVMSLALIPLFRGCEHMDIRRYERELRFGPSSIVEVFPQILISLAAWPVAKWLGDYRAILVLLLSKALLSCAASHWLAERPYAWQVHRKHMINMLRFGWPLVVNGFMMFGVFQGEQFLVATFYTMADLAPYAAAATLGLSPAYLLGRVFNPVVLPLLANAQGDADLFRRRYRQVVSIMALFSAVSGVGLLVGAEALMHIVYGEKYAGAGIILTCVAAAGSVRIVRTATSLAALAKGDSQNEMWSNGSRLLGLLPALCLALLQQPIWLVACTGLLGETLACAVAILRLRRRDNIPLMASFVPLGWVVSSIAVAAAVVWLGGHHLPLGWGLLVAGLLAAAGGGLIVVSLPELRREIIPLWDGLRTVSWRAMPTILPKRQ
jgi:O-antigen/teichoic acid export membrane protein